MTPRLLEVVQAPAQAILVDGGRAGWAHLAITRAGPYDDPAYRRASRLVGNRAEAAAVEFVYGPLVLRSSAACLVAVCGVTASVAVAAGGRTRGYAAEEAIAVPADALVTVAPARSGLRGYLAVRGGFAVEPVLGSRSRDTLADLGPPPLRPGDVLPVGTLHGDYPAAGWLPVPGPEALSRATPLPLLPAPRDAALLLPRSALAARTWTVSPDSDRVGMRLRGLPLPVAAAPDAGSEPLVRGAVQVPPDGLPVLMGPDHPTTGGYPVIGVIARDAWPALAQLRPGAEVRLVPRAGGRPPAA